MAQKMHNRENKLETNHFPRLGDQFTTSRNVVSYVTKCLVSDLKANSRGCWLPARTENESEVNKHQLR